MTELKAKQAASRHRIVFVTGPSGAGRSTAVKVLEDLGFEAIDNLPLSLLPRLLDGPALDRPMALGVDARNRDFSADSLLDLLDRVTADPRVEAELLYLDCRSDVLLRRFSETRRRHPLAPAETPGQGIDRELDLLSPVRPAAHYLVDTSDLTPHELRAELTGWFDRSGRQRLAVTLHSFSYKRGLPRGIDMIFDCRFLRNPYWQAPLRPLDGRDAEVAVFVAGDPRFEAFFTQVRDLVELLLPAYADEGKAHLSVGFGCTGGQHRSVAMTERLTAALLARGWQVSLRHHELERRTPQVPLGDEARKAAASIPRLTPRGDAA